MILVIVIIIARSVSRDGGVTSQPDLTMRAKVTGKRQDIVNRQDSYSYTVCYATFEVENGDRVELDITSEGYSMIAEGDYGMLTIRGVMCVGFVREGSHFEAP